MPQNNKNHVGFFIKLEQELDVRVRKLAADNKAKGLVPNNKTAVVEEALRKYFQSS
jgi:hypothetical protein